MQTEGPSSSLHPAPVPSVTKEDRWQDVCLCPWEARLRQGGLGAAWNPGHCLPSQWVTQPVQGLLVQGEPDSQPHFEVCVQRQPHGSSPDPDGTSPAMSRGVSERAVGGG